MKKTVLVLVIALLLPAGSAFACGVTCLTSTTCDSGTRALCEFIENGCFAYGKCRFGGGGMASNERPVVSWTIVAARVVPPSGDVAYLTAQSQVQVGPANDGATQSETVVRLQK